jgi:protease-4
MGAVAASGGYFVSLPADLIVANPGTLTGSIGVLGGKQVVRDLLDKVGVRLGAIAEGENALMMSSGRPFRPAERAKLEDFLDRVYDDFVDKVARARNMSTDDVHAVARGRVWTGADALGRGLVDQLGGLERALELAWERAGMPAAQAPRVRLVPKPSRLGPVRSPKSSEDRAAAAARSPVTDDVAAAIEAIGAAGRIGRVGATLLGGVGPVPPATPSFADGWDAFAPLAAQIGLPAGGPLLVSPVGAVQ